MRLRSAGVWSYCPVRTAESMARSTARSWASWPRAFPSPDASACTKSTIVKVRRASLSAAIFGLDLDPGALEKLRRKNAARTDDDGVVLDRNRFPAVHD